MTTEELRTNFLVPDLFNEGQVTLVHSHQDRVIVGGAVPGEGPLKLDAPDELRAEYFLQRRELGVFVIQGTADHAAAPEVLDLNVTDAEQLAALPRHPRIRRTSGAPS